MSGGPGGRGCSEDKKKMAEGRTGGDSYTPTEAALILRVTPTRVRQLLQDDELEGHRDEAGHWLIPARAVHERAERLRRESFLEAVGYDLSSVREMRELIEELRDRVRSLEGQLSEEREARRRADTIIMQLTQANASLAARIPGLEAAPLEETAEAHQEEEDAQEEPPSGTGGMEDGEEPEGRSSWWRRLFGG